MQARKEERVTVACTVVVELDVVVAGGGRDKSWLNLHATVLGSMLVIASSPLQSGGCGLVVNPDHISNHKAKGKQTPANRR